MLIKWCYVYYRCLLRNQGHHVVLILWTPRFFGHFPCHPHWPACERSAGVSLPREINAKEKLGRAQPARWQGRDLHRSVRNAGFVGILSIARPLDQVEHCARALRLGCRSHDLSLDPLLSSLNFYPLPYLEAGCPNFRRINSDNLPAERIDQPESTNGSNNGQQWVKEAKESYRLVILAPRPLFEPMCLCIGRKRGMLVRRGRSALRRRRRLLLVALLIAKQHVHHVGCDQCASRARCQQNGLGGLVHHARGSDEN